MSEKNREQVQVEKEFLSEKQLLARLPISRRTLFTWREERKIPFVSLGARKVIYHWESVKAALLRMQRPSAA